MVTGYIYMVILAVLFSFGGILVKTSGTLFSPFMISFLRFGIGIVLLILLQLLRRKPLRFHLLHRYILLAGIAKAVNYLLENIGLVGGFSYGNIFVWPVQAVVALIVSALVFHDKITKRSIAGTILCVFGVMVVVWNGAAPGELPKDQIGLFLLFLVSGIGAALFVVFQKLALRDFGSAETNLSVFVNGGAICLVPVIPGGAEGALPGTLSVPALLSMLALGAITGIGFLLQAEAVRRIPLYIATVINSATVIFSLLWAAIFFHEPVTRYIVTGSLIFLAGILMINIKLPGKTAK